MKSITAASQRLDVIFTAEHNQESNNQYFEALMDVWMVTLWIVMTLPTDG